MSFQDSQVKNNDLRYRPNVGAIPPSMSLQAVKALRIAMALNSESPSISSCVTELSQLFGNDAQFVMQALVFEGIYIDADEYPEFDATLREVLQAFPLQKNPGRTDDTTRWGGQHNNVLDITIHCYHSRPQENKSEVTRYPLSVDFFILVMHKIFCEKDWRLRCVSRAEIPWAIHNAMWIMGKSSWERVFPSVAHTLTPTERMRDMLSPYVDCARYEACVRRASQHPSGFTACWLASRARLMNNDFFHCEMEQNVYDPFRNVVGSWHSHTVTAVVYIACAALSNSFLNPRMQWRPTTHEIEHAHAIKQRNTNRRAFAQGFLGKAGNMFFGESREVPTPQSIYHYARKILGSRLAIERREWAKELAEIHDAPELEEKILELTDTFQQLLANDLRTSLDADIYLALLRYLDTIPAITEIYHKRSPSEYAVNMSLGKNAAKYHTLSTTDTITFEELTDALHKLPFSREHAAVMKEKLGEVAVYGFRDPSITPMQVATTVCEFNHILGKTVFPRDGTRVFWREPPRRTGREDHNESVRTHGMHIFVLVPKKTVHRFKGLQMLAATDARMAYPHRGLASPTIISEYAHTNDPTILACSVRAMHAILEGGHPGPIATSTDRIMEDILSDGENDTTDGFSTSMRGLGHRSIAAASMYGETQESSVQCIGLPTPANLHVEYYRHIIPRILHRIWRACEQKYPDIREGELPIVKEFMSAFDNLQTTSKTTADTRSKRGAFLDGPSLYRGFNAMLKIEATHFIDTDALDLLYEAYRRGARTDRWDEIFSFVKSVHSLVHDPSDTRQSVVISNEAVRYNRPDWEECSHWNVYEWLYFAIGRPELTDGEVLKIVSGIFTGNGQTRLPPRFGHTASNTLETTISIMRNCFYQPEQKKQTRKRRRNAREMDYDVYPLARQTSHSCGTAQQFPWKWEIRKYELGWRAMHSIVSVAEELCHYGSTLPTNGENQKKNKTFRGNIVPQTPNITELDPIKYLETQHYTFPLRARKSSSPDTPVIIWSNIFPLVGPAVDDSFTLNPRRPLSSHRAGLLYIMNTCPINTVYDDRSIDARMAQIFPDERRTLEELMHHSPTFEAMVQSERNDLAST